jgi:uncharacterized protein YbjT (DUF2867 family)
MTSSPGTSVLLVGATGLVGSHCLLRLLEEPTITSITLWLRRAVRTLPVSPRIIPYTVDFETLEKSSPPFRGHALVCALGTTMRKAGSESSFRRVDFDYPLSLARVGVARGVQHFLLVSSVGANPRSRALYTRVKGELEAQVMRLGFPSLTIVRPSFLLGDRAERRLGEDLAKNIGFLAPSTYRPVHARQVAAALVDAVIRGERGCRIIENRDLRKF